MARPRKDPFGKSAVDVMEDAFWELLAERPFAKITVSALCDRSGVNRNTFYYHFESVGELAELAITRTFPTREIALALLQGRERSDPPDSGAAFDGVARYLVLHGQEIPLRMARMRLVFGSHGTNELSAICKRYLTESVLGAFGLQKGDLDQEGLYTLTFMLGGLTECWGKAEELAADGDLLGLLTEARAPKRNIDLMLDILNEARRRKERGASSPLASQQRRRLGD